jgi:lactate permease
MDNFKIIQVLLATLPIIWLLLSIIKFKLPSWLAAISGVAITIIIAISSFKFPILRVAQSSAEGAFFAVFPICSIIVGALFVYNVTIHTGSMDKIKQVLLSVSPDMRVIVLLIAFSFGGFLEAVAGFGTAVAIPAGILVVMGCDAFVAASVCLLANTVPVAFGVLGIPVITLAQITGTSVGKLSFLTALQLSPFAIVLPIIIVFVASGGIKGVKGTIAISFVCGLVYSFVQTFTAMLLGPELAAVFGALASAAAIVLWTRFFNTMGEVANVTQKEKQKWDFEAIIAFMPYVLILFIVFITRSIPFFSGGVFVLKPQFYFGNEGKPLVFNIISNGGSVLLLAGFFGGLIQGSKLGDIVNVLLRTIKSTLYTIITVVCVVVLSKIMTYSGMINSLAAALVSASGVGYPFLAPILGMLGTFITGSDTSSNILFGKLQQQTAIMLNMNPDWLIAANTSGATIGKMISPQSIALVCASAGLAGKESGLLKYMIKYCLIFAVLMGVLIYIVAPIIH